MCTCTLTTARNAASQSLCLCDCVFLHLQKRNLWNSVVPHESENSDTAEDVDKHTDNIPPCSELQFDDVTSPTVSFPLPGGDADVDLLPVDEGAWHFAQYKVVIIAACFNY